MLTYFAYKCTEMHVNAKETLAHQGHSIIVHIFANLVHFFLIFYKFSFAYNGIFVLMDIMHIMHIMHIKCIFMHILKIHISGLWFCISLPVHIIFILMHMVFWHTHLLHMSNLNIYAYFLHIW